MTIQHKSFQFSVKAVDDEQGLIEAYGSVFDVIDEGDGYLKDVVRSGAFKRTIKNSKAKIAAGKAKFLATMLWSHDPQNHLPIGGWYDLKEDTNGLLGKGQIVLATQLGREVYELIKAGVINQFSIGYDIPEGGSSTDFKSGTRELTEIRLWEISPVVFAMNQEALLVGVKGNPVDKKQPSKDKKDFHDNYRERQISDWCGELYSMTSAFRETCQDAFKSGDQPLEDIMAALNGSDDSPGFIAEVQGWVQEGIELDYSNYLEEMQESNPSGSYGYMSRDGHFSRKAGRAISAANAGKIQDSIDALATAADTHEKAMKAHVTAVRSAADDLATILQGSEAATGTDPGDAGSQAEGKSATASRTDARRASQRPSPEDTVSEEEIAAALETVRQLRQDVPTHS